MKSNKQYYCCLGVAMPTQPHPVMPILNRGEFCWSKGGMADIKELQNERSIKF